MPVCRYPNRVLTFCFLDIQVWCLFVDLQIMYRYFVSRYSSLTPILSMSKSCFENAFQESRKLFVHCKHSIVVVVVDLHVLRLSRRYANHFSLFLLQVFVLLILPFYFKSFHICDIRLILQLLDNNISASYTKTILTHTHTHTHTHTPYSSKSFLTFSFLEISMSEACFLISESCLAPVL